MNLPAGTIAADDVARHYNKLDAFYREVWGEHVHHGLWLCGNESREVALRKMVELLARRVGARRGLRVCDIGSGYGATARLLAADYGAEVTAMTLSPAQHGFAVSRNSETTNPRYVLGDWLNNSFPDQTFDAAVACESTEHMPDKAGFFREAARVLKPGGRLVVCTWVAGGSASRREREWLLEPIRRSARMAGIASAENYRNLAAAAGFDMLDAEDVSPQVWRTWPEMARVFIQKVIRQPRYTRFLVGHHAGNVAFGLAMVRVYVAFRTGALQYFVFTHARSCEGSAST